MGNRLSTVSESFKTCRINCQVYLKRVFSTEQNRAMISHAQVIVEALKLGSLRVRLRKHLSEDKEYGHESSSFEQSVVVLDESERVLLGEQSSKLDKSFRGRVTHRFKANHRVVDLFFYNIDKNKRASLKAQKLFQHAVDCHKSVLEIENRINELLELVEKDQVTLNKAEELISVGTQMEGEISIPPQSFDETEEPQNINHDPTFTEQQQDQSRPYELTILREVLDETGRKLWIGRHQTYDGRRDKQTVLLQYLREEEGFIHFEDYETHCEGEVSEDKNRLHGHVKQLRRGRPGFFVPNRGVEHNFVLERRVESRFEKVNFLRSKLFIARFARALAFGAWCGVASNGRISNEKFVGLEVDWSQVIEDLVWICDEVGTLMRRYVTLLDSLSFTNPKQREDVLGNLAEKGVKRSSVHNVWDAATILLPRVRDNIPIGSCHSGNSYRASTNFADQVLARLDPLYNRFDDALRRADKRVCEELKAQWRHNFKDEVAPKLDSKSFSSSQKGQETRYEDLPAVSRRRKKSGRSDQTPFIEDEVVCTICTTTFDIDEPMYIPPCKHAFHVDCLDEWFKQDSVCPTCRRDFSEVTN